MMSLAKLFYLKETFREKVRYWRQACFRQRSHPSRITHQASHPRSLASRFTLETLEPRLLLSASPSELVTPQALEPAAITVPAGALPNLDVDLNGQADALSDGILIIRHLFGFTGAALTTGVVDSAGQRTDPTAIQNYLTGISSALDVDQNQKVDALSDGIMIMRSLFGFTGTALTSGAIDPAGQRTDPAVIASFLNNMNPQRELVAPLFTAGLQQDTGLSTTDTITFNPTISGTLTDISQIASFIAGFDITPVGNFVDVLADLQSTGNFTLSTARMNQLAGGTLADGSHTLHLRATDARGNISTIDRTFTLDTLAPLSPTFDLALTSDTDTLGDQQTTAAIVTIKGQTDPTTLLQVLGAGTTTLSNGTGSFQLPDLTLAVGANVFTLRASDVAGNHSDVTRTITRLAATQQADVVLTWNQTMLDAIQRDATAPPVASRGMAMVSLAMYDTINAIEGTPGYYVSLPAQTGTSADAAVASAAHRVLSYLYPGQQAFLDSQLAASLAPIANGPGKTNGIALGQSIADAIIAIRSTDGWNDFVDYVPGNQPGDWQQTSPMYDVALLPQWADLTPFALTSPSQFAPAGPPALTSQAYADAFNEVKALGSATNSTRTADQTQIARFWADGSGTYTPPGHWNQIASQIALEQGNSLSANARLFAQLNVALADAGITAWDAKYQYEFWRPITAIQQADLDGNTLTTADSNWTSFLITPPFPEYTSGHSTFSGAAAEILTSLFGANVAFTTTSLGLPNVQRSFTSFEQAAQEAGRSRIYGGIHFEFSNQDGLTSGKALADFVLNRFTVTTDTQGPTILLNQQSGTVTKTNLTLMGQVLDNLSGVAVLQAKLDNGAFAPVALSNTGTFSLPTPLLLDGTADGVHLLTFQATDNQGNNGTALFSFTLDTVLPTLTLTTPTVDQVLADGASVNGTANATGSKLVELCYQFDSGVLIPISFDPVSGRFDAPLDLSKLPVGAHVLSLRAQDAAGNVTTLTRNVSLAAPIPLTIAAVTPQPGASDVGSTFRPQVFFSRPVNTATLTTNNFYATDTTGTKLAAMIVSAQDGTFAWLFFTNPMPGAETITIHVEGDTIFGATDGQALDADGNGTAGGVFTSTFSTVSLVPLAGTTLSGKVLDPGPDLKLMTFDDVRVGPDGILHTNDDVFLNPIAGAKVFIIGLENQAVFTDAQGNFSFSAVPSGTIKLAIDGRTATNAPAGFYFPEMVMDLQIEVGQANTAMGTMGIWEAKAANLTRPEIYLPRLQTSILQTVSDTQTTMVGVNPNAAPNLTDQQRQFLTLEVQPGSLIGPDGQPLTGAAAQVGISTVPPELVRDMLPPGLLQHTFDITIQAPDAATFNTPLQITFPNVFNAAPGTKLNLLSFDHTTGRLVIEGTGTVSQDGQSVTSDPGTGITKPGWHGMTPPGSQANGDPPPPPPPDCNDKETPQEANKARAAALANAVRQLLAYYADLVRDAAECVLGGLNPTSILQCLEAVNDAMSSLKDTIDAIEKSKRDTQRCYEDAILRASGLGTNTLSTNSLETAVVTLALTQEVDDLWGVTTSVMADFRFTADRFIQMADIVGTTAPDNLSAGQIAGLNTVRNELVNYYGTQTASEFYGARIATMEPAANQIVQVFDLVSSARGFYVLEDAATGFISRGSTSAGGGISNIFLRPNTEYRLVRLFTDTLVTLETIFYTGASGIRTEIPAGGAGTDTLSDVDNDGLTDLSEFVLGTHAAIADSDADGITDLAEIQQGLNPLDNRGFPTGIIASTSLLGQAEEVVVEGSVSNPEQLTAYIATGIYGLAIVDVSQFQKPVTLSQLDLAGNATDVDVDVGVKRAAVAASAGGLHVVDITTPQAPTLVQTITINATQVEVVDGIAYVSVGGELRSYDLLTGEKRQALSLSSNSIVSFAREGRMLYTLDSDNVLRAVELIDTTMVARGTLTLPSGGGKVFVGNGTAYVGAEYVINNFNGGFITANVSNPDALVLLSGVDGASIAGRRIVANGSGVGVSVGSPGGAFAANVLDVVSLTDPTNTNNFLIRFALPAAPSSVAIGAGIAFVADGTADLQIVNYRAFDNQGQAPTVNLTTSVVDLDPATPGIQVQEGTTISLRATITDDVQVRNVELLVNDAVVRNDVSFPFDLSAVVPNIVAGPGGDIMTIQVRATDTGGNQTMSAPLTLTGVPDTVAPAIASTNVVNGAKKGQIAFRSVVVDFSEAMNPDTLTAQTIRLVPVATPNTPLVPTNIQFRNDNRSVQLTFDQLPLGDVDVIIDAPLITDRASNPLGNASITNRISIVTGTTFWINPIGGFWDDASNWSTGVLPGLDDDVLIDVAGGATVTYRTGTTTINSLVAGNPFVVSGGTLTMADTSDLQSVAISGGTLEVASSAAATSLTQSAGTLSGAGTLTVSGATSWTGGTMTGTGTLRAEGGLTLSGTAQKNLGGGRVLEHLGTGGWTGTGALQILTGNGTLRLVSGIFESVGTQSTTIFTNGVLTLEVQAGAIFRKSGGGTTSIVFDPGAVNLSLNGTVDVADGTLVLTGAGTSTGTATIAAGSTLELSGGTGLQTFAGSVTGAGTLRGTMGTVALTGLVTVGATTITGGTTTISGAGATLGAVTLTGGTLQVASPATATSLTQSAGTLGGVGTLTVSGATAWSGGTITDSGLLQSQGGLTLSGGPNKVLGVGRVIEHSGAGGWTGSGPLMLQSGGGTLRLVSGVFDVQGTQNTSGSADGFLTLEVRTGATLRKSGGGTTSLVSGVSSFSNAGTVDVVSGTLELGGPVTNTGAIALKPGALLSITGIYTQTALGAVAVDIGGTATTQFGRMTVTGVASLNGTLNVFLVNGFTPALNNRFRFMTNGSRTGSFATQNGLDLGGGLAFQVETTDPLDLELVTVAVAPASASVQFAAPAPDGSLAYVQQSWVVDYVAPTADLTANDEELIIQLA